MLSEYPDVGPQAGFASWGDDPPFYGMHEAAAAVAGGSLEAMERLLAGDERHHMRHTLMVHVWLREGPGTVLRSRRNLAWQAPFHSDIAKRMETPVLSRAAG